MNADPTGRQEREVTEVLWRASRRCDPHEKWIARGNRNNFGDLTDALERLGWRLQPTIRVLPWSETGIPPTFWRDLPCGHPSNCVAMWTRIGQPFCHCGWLLNPTEGCEIENLPGPVVLCVRCGCTVVIPPKAQ